MSTGNLHRLDEHHIGKMRAVFSRLQFKIVALILLAAVPLLVALITFIVIRAEEIIEHDANERMRIVNDSLAAKLSVWLTFNESALKQMVMIPGIVSMDPQQQKPILQAMLKSHPEMYLTFITDLNGTSIVRSDDRPPVEYGDREWFLKAKTGAIGYQTHIGRSLPEPVLGSAMPIRNDAGEMIAIGAYATRITTVTQQVEASTIGKTGFAYVVDNKNRVVAHPDPRISSVSPDQASRPREISNLGNEPPVIALRHGTTGFFTFTDGQGQRWRSYVSTIRNDWGIIVQQREDELLAPLLLFRKVSWGILAIVSVMISFLTWLVVRRALYPVVALTDTAVAIASGDLSRRAPVTSNDEIGILADRFNFMTDKLSELSRGLEQRVTERTAQLEAANKDLTTAKEAADTANKAKSVFLANMSHELRTPLNAILGFSSLLQRDTQLSTGQRENIDIINRSGEHLLKLINDVLEIAKIEAGKLQLEIAPFDLAAMAHDVISMMQARASEKGLQLIFDVDSSFPHYAKGDEARLRQILLNLVGNAVKFTKSGGVTLRMNTRQNGLSYLLIEVEDTGPGIPPEDVDRLFMPFVQLGAKGEQQGTGLGLTICRRFAELMGGFISVESQWGKGSLFRVMLPLETAEANEVMQPQATAYSGVIGLSPGQPHYRILVVEDQKENQRLLCQLISDLGLDVKLAENGEQGVQRFEDWHPDLILMDLRMPVMDGIEATGRIRQLSGGDKVRIIAVTASVFKEQEQEILKAGMDGFVRKPYRFEEIYECLAQQLGIRYLYETPTDADTTPVTLVPEQFSVLPNTLRAELGNALESLESERIMDAIAQVAAYDQDFHKALLQRVENFDYPAILTALEQYEVKS